MTTIKATHPMPIAQCLIALPVITHPPMSRDGSE